jgi:hypothetical protein
VALIQCQECGRQMSDSASKCPNCGAYLLQAVGATAFQKAGGVAAILLGGAVLLIAAMQGEELGVGLKAACGGVIGMGSLVLFARSRKK